MVIYHPIEHHYWLANHTPSGRHLGQPKLASSRALSALWLVWIGCGGAVVYLDLIEARRRLESAQRAATAARANGDVHSARAHDGAAQDAAAACATAAQRLLKLALDALLALHWTVEHPTWRLGGVQLGAVGTLSSLLALHASWARHARRLTAKPHQS